MPRDDETSRHASDLERSILETTDRLARSREQQRALQQSQRDLRTKWPTTVADKALPRQIHSSRASVSPDDPQ